MTFEVRTQITLVQFSMSEKTTLISDYVRMYNVVQQKLVKEMVDADIELMRSNPNA